MKVKLVGPGSGPMPGGYRRWAADEIVEVDDTDAAAVGWYRRHCANGGGTILEEARPAKPAQVPAESGIARLRAEARALGVQVDGRWSAGRLEQEIARASKSK